MLERIELSNAILQIATNPLEHQRAIKITNRLKQTTSYREIALFFITGLNPYLFCKVEHIRLELILYPV